MASEACPVWHLILNVETPARVVPILTDGVLEAYTAEGEGGCDGQEALL
jgi:hypothetical protein